MKPAPHSSSKPLSSPQKEPLCPLSGQFPIPSPQPPGTHHLTSVSVNVAMLSGIIYLVCPVTSGLFHLSVVPARFIHVVAGVRVSFFFMAESHLFYGCATVCLLVHQLMGSWVVSTFVVNNAATTIHVQIIMRTKVFICFGLYTFFWEWNC